MKIKIIISVIMFALIAWILSNVLNSKIDIEPPISQIQDKEKKVLLRNANNQKVNKTLVVQGTLAPIRQVDIISETAGKIKDIFVKQGQFVKKDDILLTIDQDDRLLKLEQAQSEYDLALLDHQASQKLIKQGGLSQTNFEATKANLSRAKANLETAKLELARITIKAPFDGVIDSNPPEFAQYIGMNTFILRIIDINPIVAKTTIPQTQIQNVTMETTAEVKLLTGQILQGQVHKIAPSVNESTRAFDLEIKLIKDADIILPLGISATLSLNLLEKEAVKVSAAILSLNEANQIVIKAVNSQNQVYEIPVEIVKTDIDAMWVAGVAENTNIIVRGAGFVNIGEQVKTTIESVEANPNSLKDGASL